MAEAAVIQMNGTNGLSDENQPPSENHALAVNGGGDLSSAEKKPSHSSSSGSHHKSSHGDKHRSSSSHKSSHGDKHRSSSSHKSSHGDKHRSSSGSHKSSSKDKDRDHHSSSKHKSSSKDKDRDKDRQSSSSKHHSSSSSSKHVSSSKHGSSSSSSKHHSSSSKHKSSSHDKQRSSSDKDKHRSDSDREKNREKDKHRSSDKHSSGKEAIEVKTETVENVLPVVKEEQVSPVKETPTNHIAEESEEEQMPLVNHVKQEAPVEEDSDDDVPLSARKTIKSEKRYAEDSDEDDFAPKKVKKESKKRKNDDDDFDPDEPKKKKKKEVKSKPIKQEPKITQKKSPVTPSAKKPQASPTKAKGVRGVKKEKKEGENQDKWKWWEEEPKNDGVKWHFLEHKGPVFAPPYDPLPKDVRFSYDGELMELSEPAEEVAGFYAKMLDHDYTTREVFNSNFFKDWRRVMTKDEQRTITDLSKCNFKEMYQFFKQQTEQRKNRTKEEKKQLKEENAALLAEYGFCTMDGHTEKIGNFRIEPPGLFRGRGDHPKQGMLKTRTLPEDIIINCSKDSNIPQPPEGHRWKEVRHDNMVTWLASWNENIQGATKYIMLAPTSKLKGAKDWQKYETARRLHKIVDTIRATYREDFKSKEMKVRQRAVALYFIDKLALRAGNEKDDSESADTVGCCSLRVEHITLNEELDGQEYVVEFDFLGKDSIRYYNKVPVEKRVFKNLQLFKENKNEGDDLFDRLNTTILNKHLNTLMPGLSAKVFRTYNASRTLQEQLNIMTNADDSVAAKMLSYNRANRAVAVLCNHQRAAPKNFSKQMENLQNKIDAKRDLVREAKKEMKKAKTDLKTHKTPKAKTDLKTHKTPKAKTVFDKKKKALARLEEQLMKLEVQATDKDENKEIALGTSKLNYLDPRISVSWCKKWDVPIEKVYNKTQREKFAWAIDMTEEDYDFMNLDGVADTTTDDRDDGDEEEDED